MKTGKRAIEVLDITGVDRERLLTLEESNFCDLKAVEITPRKLANTISAFANTAGGELYVGIAEEKSLGPKSRFWHGFVDQEAANGHLQALSLLFPLGSDYAYEFLRAPGSRGLVLHITVQRTEHIAETFEGKVYIRRGAQNLPVTGKIDSERLALDKGIQTFETRTVDADVALVSESDTMKEFVKQVVPNQTSAQFLQKQNLIKNGKPLVAAVLLFADIPQAVLPKRSGVKLYRYRTKGEGTRETLADTPKSLEGSAYHLIKESVAQTIKMIEGIEKLGPGGLEPIQYPRETLHEIVTNAILHRDYSLASDVQIRIFDNRIEIESPGSLPGHVTIDNILVTQFARNGMLVRLINKFPDPPNQDVGEGLNTAFKAMQKLRLKPPAISVTESALLVTIRHETLASPEESVMDYLQSHDAITNMIAREITGITSENSIKEVFYRLAKRELIERIPGRSGSAAAWQKFTGADATQP